MIALPHKVLMHRTQIRNVLKRLLRSLKLKKELTLVLLYPESIHMGSDIAHLLAEDDISVSELVTAAYSPAFLPRSSSWLGKFMLLVTPLYTDDVYNYYKELARFGVVKVIALVLDSQAKALPKELVYEHKIEPNKLFGYGLGIAPHLPHLYTLL